MAVAVGDIIRVACTFVRGAVDEYTNIFHYKVLANTTISDGAFMTEVALLLDIIYQEIDEDISSGVAFQDIDAQNITQQVLLPVRPWPTLVAGGDVSQTLPPMVAAYVHFPTLRPKTRASKFVPPYGESSNIGGNTLESGALGRLQDWGDLIQAGLVSASLDMQMGAYNSEFSRFTAVDSAVASETFRTQRRRRPGVGS